MCYAVKTQDIYKNMEADATNKVQIQQPIKKPQDYGTLATIFTVKGEESVKNQQHNKALNSKISSLVDAIIDEEPISKYLPKDSNDSTTSLESLSRR